MSTVNEVCDEMQTPLPKIRVPLKRSLFFAAPETTPVVAVLEEPL
jgi:hypothetical protein